MSHFLLVANAIHYSESGLRTKSFKLLHNKIHIRNASWGIILYGFIASNLVSSQTVNHEYLPCAKTSQ